MKTLMFDLEHGSQTLGSKEYIHKQFGFPVLQPGSWDQLQDTISKLYKQETVTEKIKVGTLEIDEQRMVVVPRNGTQVDAHSGDFDEFYFQDHNDIVILGFDSMKSRLEAVTTICSNPTTRPKCIIDGRMGAEHYQQYILPKPTLQKYMKVWYSDEQGDEEPCNAKATSYCSNMSGSFIANSVRKFITDSPLNGNFSFHFPTMMLEKLLVSKQ